MMRIFFIKIFSFEATAAHTQFLKRRLQSLADMVVQYKYDTSCYDQ
jgi:hypothetical protein